MSTVPVPLRAARERTTAELCEHFAADHLSESELERRLDQVHIATTMAELQALLGDLPAMRGTMLGTVPTAARLPSGARASQLLLAVMGGSKRSGTWAPAEKVVAVACMGGVVMDFREARLPPGITDIYVCAVMGGVEIIVPPGLRVDAQGLAVMGGFEHRDGPPGDSHAPVLRVRGVAVMGGVDIRVRPHRETHLESAEQLRAP